MQIGVETAKAVDQRRVFVVDEDEVTRAALQFMLHDEIETHELSSLEEAYAKGQGWLAPDVILLGVSMWLQQKLNPAPTDPTQQMIFAWMPWVFMFMLGNFAAGLVLYWITNNVVTFVQQYAIMRSHGAKPDVFGNIKSGFKRKKAAEARAAKAANAPGKPKK